MLAGAAGAGKIYTWTDSSGVTHITETPPPAGGRLQEVLEYTPKTEAEQEAIRDQRQQNSQQRQQENLAEAARSARRRADAAKEQAARAQRVADETFQQAEAFRTKTSNTIRRWQVNKATRLQLEAETAKARAEAERAAEEAARLEEEAKAAEDKVKQFQRPEPAPEASTDAEPQPR